MKIKYKIETQTISIMKKANIWHLDKLTKIENQELSEVQDRKLMMLLEDIDPSYYNGISFSENGNFLSDIEIGNGIITVNVSTEDSPMGIQKRFIDLDEHTRINLINSLHREIDRKITEENE